LDGLRRNTFFFVKRKHAGGRERGCSDPDGGRSCGLSVPLPGSPEGRIAPVKPRARPMAGRTARFAWAETTPCGGSWFPSPAPLAVLPMGRLVSSILSSLGVLADSRISLLRGLTNRTFRTRFAAYSPCSGECLFLSCRRR